MTSSSASTSSPAALWPAPLERALAGQGQPFDAPEGAHLFSPGAACTHFLLLTSGTVRVQMLAPSGREIVLYRLRPGESCVMTTACLLGGRAYLGEGIAETALRGVLIDARAFERLIAASADFRAFVFGAFAARLAELAARIEEIALERIDVRLARWLLHGPDTIERTHYAIAVELGSAREVVSRQLKDFEQRGWLVLRRGCVELLARAALRALAEGCSAQVLAPCASADSGGLPRCKSSP
jgi:CRP/FNR family transcriptional regulator